MGGTSGPLRNLVPPPAYQRRHFIHHSTSFLRKKKKIPNTTNKQNLVVSYDDVFKGKPLLWLVVCFSVDNVPWLCGSLGWKGGSPRDAVTGLGPSPYKGDKVLFGICLWLSLSERFWGPLTFYCSYAVRLCFFFSFYLQELKISW